MKLNPVLKIFVLLLITSFGAGCSLPTPPEATEEMTAGELRGVLKCQRAIRIHGQSFVKTKLRSLESCASGVTTAALKEESGDSSEGALERRDRRANANCERQINKVGKASYKMVDRIVKACEPVEQVLFDPAYGDPLRFNTLFESFEDGPIGASSVSASADTPEDTAGAALGLAGMMCALKELAVDAMLFVEFPRFFAILDEDGGFENLLGALDEVSHPACQDALDYLLDGGIPL